MNAIILAAGLGSRLEELTVITPKPLLRIKDTTIIETQIRYLKERGIDDIYIVTGYQSHKFQYLHEKHAVKLIYNPDYALTNNLYSLASASGFLEDTYILEGDVFMNRNFIPKDTPFYSTYFSGLKENWRNEWVLDFDRNLYLRKIILPREHNDKLDDKKRYIMSGVSFWKKDDSIKIYEYIHQFIKYNSVKQMYWDYLIVHFLNKFQIQISTIAENDWFEIDNKYDLMKLQEYFY
ncbi:phosphocholine cytidylyltransferase family protein [Sphingobacterium sp. GVS05A]|uniref:phosphocholine cytidylyltransferase family protein n=1 Tax=Sphingobacterium sp. GVS05A TaxID=2862679 RepID=UPI001CC076F4|nr:phosphocholine cytidylyltransferase family protein [Sphingobacterium sp. GVS05A]